MAAKLLPNFMKNKMLPRLGNEYTIYKKYMLVRSRGCIYQGLSLNLSRGEIIDFTPLLITPGYRVDIPDAFGALDPTDYNKNPKLYFDRETVDFNDEVANNIIKEIERESPISLLAPLTDVQIDKAFKWFHKKINHTIGVAYRYSIFLFLSGNTEQAIKELAKARRYFNKKMMKAPFVDWKYELKQAFERMESYMQSPDGVLLCREEVRAHAESLELPAVIWPEEWPTENIITPPKKTFLSKFFGG